MEEVNNQFDPVEEINDDAKSKTNTKPKFRKYLWTLWLIFAIPIVAIIILFYLIVEGKLGYMPPFEELENPKSLLASEIISSDGEILGTYFVENRSKVDFEDLSPHLVDALIATEDIRYYKHSGVDARALARAVAFAMIGQSRGGGSTVSQQLAKQLFHDPARNIWERVLQKLNEWVIAVKLEKSYTKDEIIAMYFNKFDFLNHAVGIKTASRVYFNTSPDSLRIEQAALLVGMCKNPSFYNPVRERRKDTTLHRRNVVFSQMMKYGYLSKAEFDSLKVLPLDVTFSKVDHNLGSATYFREFLRTTMNRKEPERKKFRNYSSYKADSTRWANDPLYGWCNKNLKADSTTYNIYRDGLKIYATIDSRMQGYAENAVSKHLGETLQDAIYEELRKNKYPPFSNDVDEEIIDRIMTNLIIQSNRYIRHRGSGLSKDSIMKIFDVPTEMRVFAWGGDIDTVMTPKDSIIYYLHYLRAGFMSMNPHSGHVKAYVGGIDYRHFKYDHVYQGKRQVGSTIKPFLYTIAMQEGYSPCYEVPNIPTTFQMPDNRTWTPHTTDRKEYIGKDVTLKWGLAHSSNYISAWLMKQFSPKPFVNLMKKAGVKSYMDPVPSMILGTSDIKLFEMVGAYSMYANKGIYTEPIFVTRIEDKHGNVISTFKARQEDVINEKTAYLMINLLQGVVRQGSGVRLRYKYQLMNEIGGKTGTTDNHSDGWFMGVTPDLVSGAWVGGEVRSIHFEGLKLGQGANMALPIFAEYMQSVYADSLNLGISTRDFDAPLQGFDFELDCDKAKKQDFVIDGMIDNGDLMN